MSNFDFSGVESAKPVSYLTPGVYNAAVSEASYTEVEGKNPYVNVTFTANEGAVSERFYITPAAMPRLQALHEGLVGKKVDKAFASAKEVGNYFVKVLTSDQMKKINKRILVGGDERPDGAVFGKIGFSGFILPADSPLPDGPFEVGSREWILNVRKSKDAQTVGGTNQTNLGPDSAAPSGSNGGDSGDDLPF